MFQDQIDDGTLQRVGKAAAGDAGLESAALLGDFLVSVVAAARQQRRLTRWDLAACESQGRRSAELGVASRAAVDLYLSAVWRLWRGTSPKSADDTHASALFFLRAADDGVAALMSGYQLARADHVRLQEAQRHEVMDALISGGNRALEVSQAGVELGLDLAGPTVAAVVGGIQRIDHGAGVGIPSRVERALQGKHSDAQPLVTFRDGHLLVLASAPDAAASRHIADTVAAVVQESIGPPGSPPQWRVALSGARVGAGAVRRSVAEAHETLDLAERTHVVDTIIDSSSVAAYRILVHDREAAVDLVQAILDPLRDARGGARPLLDTLAVYFESGGNATRTASRLHLSVRAVTYRLTRVADLLGRDPTDPAERLTLHAAVTTAQLLNWPDVAETRQSAVDDAS